MFIVSISFKIISAKHAHKHHPETPINNQYFINSLLTLYQTTNFRHFQTERVCRWQFQIWQKCQKVILMDWKHCGKRQNCSSRAISPFPSVFKRLVTQGCQKVLLCGNGLTDDAINKQASHSAIQHHSHLLGWRVGTGCTMWPSFKTLSKVVLPALSSPKNINFPFFCRKPNQ